MSQNMRSQRPTGLKCPRRSCETTTSSQALNWSMPQCQTHAPTPACDGTCSVPCLDFHCLEHPYWFLCFLFKKWGGHRFIRRCSGRLATTGKACCFTWLIPAGCRIGSGAEASELLVMSICSNEDTSMACSWGDVRTLGPKPGRRGLRAQPGLRGQRREYDRRIRVCRSQFDTDVWQRPD